MTWVLLEILLPLVLAIALGVFIGWLLWRWRRRQIHASEWNDLTKKARQAEADVAAIRAAYEEANNERTLLSSRASELTSELEQANEQLAAAVTSHESADLHLQATQAALETSQSSLESTQDALTATRSELARLEAELTNASSTREEHDLTHAGGESTALLGELEAALAAARSELDLSQRRIADFETQLEATQADLAAARAHALESADDPVVDSPRLSGGIDIAPADHVDDLKAISGIGPRLEELLITLGITSWEQLAALDEAGVTTVDAALEDFPGRIVRDEWVKQAKDLVAKFPDVSNRPGMS